MTGKERRVRVLRGWLLADEKTIAALESGKMKTGARTGKRMTDSTEATLAAAHRRVTELKTLIAEIEAEDLAPAFKRA